MDEILKEQHAVWWAIAREFGWLTALALASHDAATAARYAALLLHTLAEEEAQRRPPGARPS